jgi:hypothetical protein
LLLLPELALVERLRDVVQRLSIILGL